MVTKNKLIKARKQKEYKQDYLANVIGKDGSCYCRKEKGEIKIFLHEWQKLAEALGVPLEDIYEPDENSFVVFNDNASGVGNVAGDNVINYSIPQSLLDMQKKYCEKMEEENQEWKDKYSDLEAKYKDLGEKYYHLEKEFSTLASQ